MAYHAHVYFRPQETEIAKDFVSRLKTSSLVHFVHMFDKPVGPHPTGMLEYHFRDSDLENVVQLLESHRQNLSILVHKDTGDDVRDHTENIRWLGQPIQLDFEFFELIKTRPDLKVHKDD